MWLPTSFGLRLSQQLAVTLDRIFVDIALHRVQREPGTAGNPSTDAVRDAGLALERFSSVTDATQTFRPAPLCFAPLRYSPAALYEAADLAAGFAYRIGKMLEERLGVPTEAPDPAPFDSGDLAARLDELIAQTDELLRSGDWATAVLAHRTLMRAQALCVLLARFRQIRVLAHSALAATIPVLTELPAR